MRVNRCSVVLATTLLLFLAACSGGGGGGSDESPPPAPATTATSTAPAPAATPPVAVKEFKCPNGTLTATAADCPLTKLTASVAQGGVVSTDGFKITVDSDGDMGQASLTETNITLWAGAVDVPGNAVKGVIVPGSRSTSFTPVVKLNFGQSGLKFRMKALDTLGRVVEISIDFSTTAMVCASVEPWSDDLGTCVAMVGRRGVSVNQLQDASCVSTEWTFEKECFTDAVRNGTIKVAASSAKVNTHAVVFAFFKDAAGANVILPFDVNDMKKPVPIGGNILDGLAVATINAVTGNSTGFLSNLTVSAGTGNYQFHYDTVLKKFVGVKL